MMKTLLFSSFIVGARGTTAATAEILPTATALSLKLKDEAECKKFFDAGSGNYGNLGMEAFAAEIVKLVTELTTDDVTFPTAPACSAATPSVLTLSPQIFVKKGLAKDAADVKTALDGKTAAAWKTILQTACDSVTEITTKATIDDTGGAALAMGTKAEVNGLYGKLTVTLTAKWATAGDCAKVIAVGAAGQDLLAGSLVTASGSKIEATEVTFPGIPTSCTSEQAAIPFTVIHTREKKVNLAAADTAIKAYALGTSKTTADSWWKLIEAYAGTGDLAEAPTYSTASAVALQTASETVSASIDLTTTNYAECITLRSRAVILNLKKKIMADTGALVGHQVVTITCKAAVATMYVSVTSATGEGGNTLAADVKTTLAAITDWGTLVKTEADKVLATALAKCTGGAGTFSAPAAVVTSQAAAMRVSGQVVYGTKNRADCEDIKGKASAILTQLNTVGGADTNTGSSAAVTCVDKVATLDYSILTAAAAAAGKMGQDVANKLNGPTVDWKKIITDALAAGTAVTLEDAALLTVTTIGAATVAATTTTSTTTSTSGTTAKYVAMSSITLGLSMTATESDCLNMKDAGGKSALAAALLTESQAPTGAVATATVDCGTTKDKPVITIVIVTPTAGTPTPATIGTALNAISPADYTTKLKAGIKAAGLTEPTITGLTISSQAKVTTITTTKGPTTTFTGSTTKGTKKELKGTLKFQVAAKADCDKIAAKNGIDALKAMFKTITGIDVTNIAIVVTCTAVRRLSDGRRLAAYNAAAAYTITVPANSAVAASTVSANLKAESNTTWTTKVTNALAAAATPITVTITNMAKTDPTTTTIHDVSSAMMWFGSPLATVFILGQFLF